VKKGTAIQKQDTYIPVHEYLELGLEGGNDIYVYVTMDIGGSSPITRSLYFNIDVTEMNLEWDYDYTRPDSIHYVD
jgi:hypothetical protein